MKLKYPAPAVSTGGMTKLNLGDGTGVNTSQLNGGSSTLAEASTLVLAAVHGTITDASVDGYANLQDIGSPATYGGLRMVIKQTGTFPSGEISGGNVGVAAMISDAASLTDNVGYYAGFYIKSSNDEIRGLGPGRIGTQVLNAVALDDADASTGTVWTEFTVYFDASDVPRVCSAGFSGEDDASAGVYATISTGTWTNVYAGIGIMQLAASPTAGTSFEVEVWYQWIERP